MGPYIRKYSCFLQALLLIVKSALTLQNSDAQPGTVSALLCPRLSVGSVLHYLDCFLSADVRIHILLVARVSVMNFKHQRLYKRVTSKTNKNLSAVPCFLTCVLGLPTIPHAQQ